MQWYCRLHQKFENSKTMTIAEPIHRFYQRKQGRQQASVLDRHLQPAIANPAGNQGPRLRQWLQNERYEVAGQQPDQLETVFHLNPQGEVPPMNPATDLKVTSPIRVAWLQQNPYHLPKALSLRTRFSEAGMQVNIHQWSIDDVAPLDCDLILFECFEIVEQEMMNFLLKLRFFTQAPLIILTDNYALDWSIWALRGGADAVFTVNMPDEVIVARSNALLRRWIVS